MRLVTILLATAMMLASTQGALAQEAKGDWWGVLQVNPAAKLLLAIHIKPSESGSDALIGTLDSPDQKALGMPLADIVAKDGKLAFALPAVAGAFEGVWDAAARVWRGTWSQSGMAWPLVLSAGNPPASAAAPPPAPLPPNWAIPDDAAIAGLIDTRIADRAGEGIVMGVIEPTGRRMVARGPAGSATFDGRTLFEIGSMSKVFTALLLADMALHKQVSLDDPAEKYLPAGRKMPERNGRKITLRDLSMHVSGLPRLPDNMAFTDIDDPYADYSEAQLLDFLGRYQLTRDIGAQFEYSNLGVGLLGYLLSRAAGTDYETLLKTRITGPLGMRDTGITLSDQQKARFAQGHDIYMRPAKPWNLPILAGAGGIRSTSDDMLKFLAAAMDPKSPIGPAMDLALSSTHSTGNPAFQIALGWMVTKPSDMLFHSGGTGGFRTAMAIDRAKRRGIVVLTNSAIDPGAEDLAIHMMLGAPVVPAGKVPPAPPPRKAHSEIKLPAADLDKVVGTYEILPTLRLKVWREGEGLMAQMSGAPPFPLFAEAPLSFFWKVVNADVRFIEEGGKVIGAMFWQDGQEARAKKLP